MLPLPTGTFPEMFLSVAGEHVACFILSSPRGLAGLAVVFAL